MNASIKVVRPNIRAQVALTELLASDDGTVNAVWARELGQFSQTDISAWCCLRGVYGIPTQELVQYLRPLVANERAIEICSGCNGLGRKLGIPETDSGVQESGQIARAMAAQGQVPVELPKGVDRLDALSAIEMHRPTVVVGSWVTEAYLTPWGTDGFYGVDEEYILREVRRYILIGNDSVHSRKRIMRMRPQCIRASWLYSRGFDRDQNGIWIWELD